MDATKPLGVDQLTVSGVPVVAEAYACGYDISEIATFLNTNVSNVVAWESRLKSSERVILLGARIVALERQEQYLQQKMLESVNSNVVSLTNKPNGGDDNEQVKEWIAEAKSVNARATIGKKQVDMLRGAIESVQAQIKRLEDKIKLLSDKSEGVAPVVNQIILNTQTMNMLVDMA